MLRRPTKSLSLSQSRQSSIANTPTAKPRHRRLHATDNQNNFHPNSRILAPKSSISKKPRNHSLLFLRSPTSRLIPQRLSLPPNFTINNNHHNHHDDSHEHAMQHNNNNNTTNANVNTVLTPMARKIRAPRLSITKSTKQLPRSGKPDAQNNIRRNILAFDGAHSPRKCVVDNDNDNHHNHRNRKRKRNYQNMINGTSNLAKSELNAQTTDHADKTDKTEGTQIKNGSNVEQVHHKHSDRRKVIQNVVTINFKAEPNKPDQNQNQTHANTIDNTIDNNNKKNAKQTELKPAVETKTRMNTKTITRIVNPQNPETAHGFLDLELNLDLNVDLELALDTRSMVRPSARNVQQRAMHIGNKHEKANANSAVNVDVNTNAYQTSMEAQNLHALKAQNAGIHYEIEQTKMEKEFYLSIITALNAFVDEHALANQQNAVEHNLMSRLKAILLLTNATNVTNVTNAELTLNA